MMKYRVAPVHLTLLATAILVLSSGCTKKDVPPPAVAVTAKPVVVESATPAVAVESPPVSAESLILLDFKIDKNEAGKPVLKGHVSNTSPYKIAYATATFKLFDKKGRVIGTSTASVDDLKAKFSWTFQVEIVQEGAVSAKLAGFTAK